MLARLDAKTITLAAAILGAAAIIAIGGPLNPPAGPVASSYKTLAEVEPRTAINATNTPGDADSVFRISQAGSYYLTGNLAGVLGKAGIEVAAGNVTIDLNGFRLQGAAGSLSGIRVTVATSGVSIRNGEISGWIGDGIDASLASDCSFSELILSSNVGDGLECGKTPRISGCAASFNTASGFRVRNGATIQACTARSNGNHGFLASDPDTSEGLATLDGCTSTSNTEMGFSIYTGGALTGCRADLNGSDGIGVGNYGVISACAAIRNTGRGIVATARRDGGSISGGSLTITGCNASENGDDGIYTINGRCVVTDCVATSNTGNGIHVFSTTYVHHNTCGNNGLDSGDGAGIFANAGDNRIEANNVMSNDRGIHASAAGNIIVGNSAANNTTNYELAANNVVGTIVQGALSPAISGPTGGSGVGTTNPWANLSF